ncbi:MAG: M23 family metallopeptidase [Candidatus Dojkabacteria bacterium]
MQNLINKVKNLGNKIDKKAILSIFKRFFAFVYKYIKIGIKNLPRIGAFLLKILKFLFKIIISLPGRFATVFSSIKSFFLVRSFWGRTNFYTRYFHVTIIFLTVLFFLTGLLNRLTFVGESNALSAKYIYANNGNVDSLEQGVGIATVTSNNSDINYKVTKYTTNNNDNLDSIAAAFGVSKDTIKWANQSKIDYYSETFVSGETLQIPEINGVLYAVQSGDTLESVLSKTSGDRFQVIELNQLGPPNYDLPVNGIIFIPNGSLPAPARPQPIYYYVNPNVDYGALANISFINPMVCGYSIARGFTGQYIYGLHDGIDFSAAYGCPVVAAAAGRVYYAGWADGGQGNMVAIDHGNGVYTLYYHSSQVYVTSGTYVNAGDVIMAVGCTGNCTGPHLHFSLRLGSTSFIDPAPYVPH